MKLSEAIRAGAKLRAMGYYHYFREGCFEIESSCSLGAAYEAVYGTKRLSFDGDGTLGIEELQKIDFGLYSSWPTLAYVWGKARPDQDGLIESLTLHDIIQFMNDSGKFTREEIADWLESIGE